MAREIKAKRPSGMQPSHPGAILRDDVLPALAITTTEAARLLGVSRQSLHAILSGRSGITPAMALRIGKLCGNGPDIWLRMQQAHDLWHAQRKMAEEIAAIPTRRAA